MSSFLNFTNELPPGAQIVSETQGPRGVDKKAVEAELRARPGQWSLVYENAHHRTVTDWKKRPGFQVASEPLEGNSANGRRYKVWLRYMGVADEPTAEQVEPKTELDEVNDPTIFDDADHVDISEAPLPAGVTVPQTVDPFDVPVGTGDSEQSTQPPAPLPVRAPLPTAPQQTAFQKQFTED